MKALAPNSMKLWYQKVQCMNWWFNIIIRKNEYGEAGTDEDIKNIVSCFTCFILIYSP